MESISEESKLLYDILKSETTEIYEAKWASYRARATAAAATARSTTRSTTPLRAPSGTASGEPSSATSMPTSALVVPRASSGEAAISTATPVVASIRAASYTRTPAGAALLDSTPAPVLSSTTATVPTTPATSGVIPTTKHDSTKGDLSPEARHLYDLPVGDSATATSAAPRCDRSSAVPIGGIPEPAAATATLERGLRSVTPSTCSTVCVRVDTSATSTLSSPLASSASITASPTTVAAALVSPLLDSCDHITAPPAICLILRPNATIDTGVSEACSINLVLAPGASALLAAFLVDNVETTKHTENRLQPWPPPRYATFLEENMCKDRPQVLLWHWFVVESMQLMFWDVNNPCPPSFPNISTVFCFASSRILNLHSTLDKLQLSGDCQVFWTSCYIAYLHWSPGVITLAFPDWKMLYSSIETWVNVNRSTTSTQWAITLQLSTSSGASLVILNERAEVQHLYTWTRVLSVAVCKGGIYHHILGVNPHYSVLMKCSFSRSQLQSEIQISTAGHILFIRCALMQWNNSSAISGVSVHFWFQYCSTGLHGCEKFQWTIAWFLSYHSSLCSLQIRSAGAIPLVQQNCPAIVDSKLFSVMRALRLDAAHKLLTDMPNVSTFVPWPSPSTHAGQQLIHGQYSSKYWQVQRTVKLKWSAALIVIIFVPGVKEAQPKPVVFKWADQIFHDTHSLMAGTRVDRLLDLSVARRIVVLGHISCSSSAFLASLNGGAEVQQILQGDPHYYELMQWSFNHSQLQSEFRFCTPGYVLFFCCMFVEWRIPWTIRLVSLKSWFHGGRAEHETLYSYENFQWTIAWLFSESLLQSGLEFHTAGNGLFFCGALLQWKKPCDNWSLSYQFFLLVSWLSNCPLLGDWFLPCSVRRVLILSVEKLQWEIAGLIDLALVECKPWIFGFAVQSSLGSPEEFYSNIKDIHSRSTQYLEVHIMDAIFTWLHSLTDEYAGRLYWLLGLYSSCTQFVTEVGGHLKVTFALLFSWDLASSIDSVPAIIHISGMFSHALQNLELGNYFAEAILLLSTHLSQAWVLYLPTTSTIQCRSKLIAPLEIASANDDIWKYTRKVPISWDPGGSNPVHEAATGINWNRTRLSFLHLTWDPGGYTPSIGLRASRILRRGDCQRPRYWAGRLGRHLGHGPLGT